MHLFEITVRYAVISDIHANQKGLERVLDDIDIEGVDRIFCCGDVVGYGEYPNDVVETLIERNIPTVKGNHDVGVFSSKESDTWNPHAQEKIKVHRKLLIQSNKDWLGELPLYIVDDDLRFVHAMPPDSYSRYVFEVYKDRIFAGMLMKETPERISFVGHTHQLGLYKWNGSEMAKFSFVDDTMYLDSDSKYVVNVGSAGKPRGQENLTYIIYDSDRNCVTAKWVEMPEDYIC